MTTVSAEPKHKDGPKFYAVLDVESSGLLTASKLPFAKLPNPIHKPGEDADCLLEVGLIVLDADTLEERYRNEWLVLPPGVRSENEFDAWTTMLRETNPFVFEMHSKDGPPIKDGLRRLSLLASLRAAATLGDGVRDTPPRLAEVEDDILAALLPYTGKDLRKDVHPGNSLVMLTGNSLSNLDIPLLKLWMPRVHNILSYRIMDVSVLRTFFVETSKVALPPGLAESIKAGASEHRAMADVELCVKNLRELRAYARVTHEAYEARLSPLFVPASLR